MKIVIGATAAGHKGPHADHWLKQAQALRQATPHPVDYFLAAEVQPDGIERRLDSVVAQVRELGGSVWTYLIDDGSQRITSGNRLLRICQGRNLVIEYALRTGADWVLFVDADIEIAPDTIVRMLELDHPFCGFAVPGYGLSGPTFAGPDFPVQVYQNTAGAWFVHRSLFRRFRWLWDPDDGLTDDPATYRVIRDQLKCEQRNRLDVIGRHPPLRSFEHRSADLGLRRHPLSGHPVVAVMPAYFPTSAHVDMTVAALRALLDENLARIYLFDNGGVAPHPGAARDQFAAIDAEHGDRFQVVAAEGCNIHQMWNLGWAAALRDFGDQVLISFVNNDISFRPGTIEVLARAVLRNEVWATFPDPACRVADGAGVTGRTRATRGSKRHGGLTGHCFLIKGAIHTVGGLAMFDTRFKCWYGDDDFAFRVERAGYQIHCVEGLPCDHVNEATMPYRPEWAAGRDADRRLFVDLWGPV
jgi:glycosyltransferase involved in cell wall biosynthesis